MAYDSLNHSQGAEASPLQAGTNLTGGQYRAVCLTGTGVLYAISVTSGLVGVLYNTPSSGQAAQFYGPGHVVKGLSSGVLTPGMYVTVTGSSCFTASSAGDAGRVGNAYCATSTVSGDIVPIRLS